MKITHILMAGAVAIATTNMPLPAITPTAQAQGVDVTGCISHDYKRGRIHNNCDLLVAYAWLESTGGCTIQCNILVSANSNFNADLYSAPVDELGCVSPRRPSLNTGNCR